MNERKKKLIEVARPLDAINQASGREKSVHHGHPSTVHVSVGAAAPGGGPRGHLRANGGRPVEPPGPLLVTPELATATSRGNSLCAR